MWKNLILVKRLRGVLLFLQFFCKFENILLEIICSTSVLWRGENSDFGRWRLAQGHTQQVSDRVRAKTQISREWSSTESVGVCVWMAKVEPPLFTSLFIFLVP